MSVTKNTVQEHSASGAARSVKWIAPAYVPLDRNGPVARPYDEPATDFVERPISEWFERIASAMPDAGALCDGKTTLTYREVRTEVGRLAAVISAQVPEGRAVAVVLPNAPCSLIAVLACFSSGRCCLVLNAEHPAERNATILADAGVHAVIVLTGDAVGSSMLPPGTAVILFDAVFGDETRPPAFRTLSADDPAIVLYTSGSSGRPKGIVLSQATALTRVRNQIVTNHLGPSDRFLSLGALGTTAGLMVSLIALLSGILQLVVSVPAAGASNLLGLIRERRVTILWGVPALLRLLFEDASAAEALATLRTVRTFGDRLLSTEWEAWKTVLPATCHFAITYGQTEATIAQWFVPRDFRSDESALPTGYLLAEHEYEILDENGNRASAAQGGELVVRGRHVALGEWEHGQVVPGRVQADPVDATRRILPTGDLVRLRPDGLLQVIGRADRQVKINGQRVEPAEIEDALRRAAGVADAAVAVRRNEETATLIAFVVSRDPHDTGMVERARAAIRLSLPGYMQPSRILAIARLPMLPGGKIDQQALLKIEAATPLVQRTSAQPASRDSRPAPDRRAGGRAVPSADAQRAVTLAWRRVLGSKPLPGVTFLEAAGDSLRLLELVFALESRTGAQLPLEVFSAEASAAEMAIALDAALRNPAPSLLRFSAFLLPGARGDTPGLAGLRADCLPFVAIQMVTYPDWRQMVGAGLALDGIAQAAVAQIRALSAPGPVGLVGYSFGAYAAFAAAGMLEAAGREVAQLVLIDMPPPSHWTPQSQASMSFGAAGAGSGIRERSSASARELWWSAERLVRAAREGTAAERLGMTFAPVAAALARRPSLRTLASSRATQGWSRRFGDVGYWTRHHMGQELRLQAAEEWASTSPAPPTRLRAPLLLIRGDAPRRHASEDLGWNAFVETVRVVRVPGTHVTMLSAAHRKTVSDAVAPALADALAISHRSADRMVV